MFFLIFLYQLKKLSSMFWLNVPVVIGKKCEPKLLFVAMVYWWYTSLEVKGGGRLLLPLCLLITSNQELPVLVSFEALLWGCHLDSWEIFQEPNFVSWIRMEACLPRKALRGLLTSVFVVSTACSTKALLPEKCASTGGRNFDHQVAVSHFSLYLLW